MNIRFTLSQMDNYALNETRFYEFYNLARSYAGIEDGEFWSDFDCFDFLHSNVLIVYSKKDDGTHVGLDGDRNISREAHGLYVSMCQTEFEISVLVHAFYVHRSMQNLKESLGKLHRKEIPAAMIFPEIKHLGKHLKQLLEATEL
jgi:hypothetical protein